MSKIKIKIKSHNILILNSITFLHGLMFFFPILSLYLQQSLFTVANVALIFSIQSISSAIFEVPTGAIADLFGRKKTIILSTLVYILGLVSLYIGGGMMMFAAFAVLSALSGALYSGTDTAIMYDTLKNEGKEKYFKKLSGTYWAIWPLGATIGSIVGGYMATISLRTPVGYSLIPYALVLLASFFIVEPKYEKKVGATVNSHMLESVKDVLKNKQMLVILAGGVIAWSFGESSHNLSQIFYQFKQVPIIWFGFITAASFGLSSLGFYLSHDVSERFGNKNTVIASIVIAFSFLILATLTPSYIAIILFTVSSFFFGLRSPVLGHLWNEESESRKRATLNSINSLVFQLGGAIAMPIIGYWADLFTINTAFLISGIIVLVISTGFYAFLKKN